MAHADYACCCICTSKMEYEGFSENHKRRLCASCAVTLMKLGVEVTSADDVLAWITSHDAETVLAVLKQTAFEPCYYENAIDTAVAALAGNPDYHAPFKNGQQMVDTLIASLGSPPPTTPTGEQHGSL